MHKLTLQLLVDSIVRWFKLGGEHIEDFKQPINRHWRTGVKEAFEELHHVGVEIFILLFVINDYLELALFLRFLEVEVDAMHKVAVHELAVKRLRHGGILLQLVKGLVARLFDDIPFFVNYVLLDRLNHLIRWDSQRQQNLDDLLTSFIDRHANIFPKQLSGAPYF